LAHPAGRVPGVARRAGGDGRGQRAPAEAINFLKALPKDRYQSAEEVLRDFAEAERRFALGNAPDDRGRRDNLGKISAEDQGKRP